MTEPVDPVARFAAEFDQALALGIRNANAMALATVGPDGAPAVRQVLLKHFDQHGFGKAVVAYVGAAEAPQRRFLLGQFQ